MPGHLLGVLEPSVVLQVNRDAGCSPRCDNRPGVRKPAALALCRIGAEALYRFSARPVTAVPSELTLWNRVARLKACGHNVLVQDLEQEVVEHLLR